MAKRRLSQRQRQHIQRIQEKRRARAELREIQQQTLTGSELGNEQAGLVVAHYGAHITIEDTHGVLHRCSARQNLAPLACGDRIVWQQAAQGEGVITALMPRASVLERPGYDGRLKPVAANIDQIIVVTAPIPEPSEALIDRYLVAAEVKGFHPIILLNKIDLLDEEQQQALLQRLSIYEQIGYTLKVASSRREHGLDALRQLLTGKTSILVGQSGVGKSSLVKALIPDLEIRIGAISEESGLGRHTTTTSMLYHLADGGNLIDTPGVRDFGIKDIDPERVSEGFPEFAAFLGHCRFNNCSHKHEPGCALQAAVQEQRIDARRLASYHLIKDGLEEAAAQF